MITITPYRFQCDRYVAMATVTFDTPLAAVAYLLELTPQLSFDIGEGFHQVALPSAVVDVANHDLSGRTLLPQPLVLTQEIGYTAVGHIRWEIDLKGGNFTTAEGLLRWMAKHNSPAAFAQLRAGAPHAVVGFTLEVIPFRDVEGA